MEKVLEFLTGNSAAIGVIMLVVGMLVSKFLPVSMFRSFGEKVGDKFTIDEKILKMFNERVDALQEGLANSQHEGRSDITSNEQIKEATDKLKTDISKLGK